MVGIIMTGGDPDLSAWRRQGPDIIARRRAEYDALLERARRLMDRRRHAQAVAALQAAANYAVLWHTGQFTDPRIEAMLRRLGRQALHDSGPGRPPRDDGAPRRVLHVATELYGIGGHARMVAHWIRNDPQNVHSLALTGQHHALPQDVADAVRDARGSVTCLNARPGGLLRWARGLQALMARADIVVLHVHNMDVVPMIALAGLENRPPSMMVNHGDHQFWLGSGVVDLIVSTRDSGRRLGIDRRGVTPERSALIPLCLGTRPRQMPRDAARQALGIPADAVVVLTIARAVKFRDIGGDNFVQALLPVMKVIPRMHMIVVGPGPMPAWQASIAQVPGQVHLVAETTQTQPYLDAADIYLDAFPFVSITSLLEAGLQGLPLVTRSAYGPDCGVMAADSPGLDGVMLNTGSVRELRETVAMLVQEDDHRRQLGAQTQERIAATNTGTAWRDQLQALYRRAESLPRNPGILAPQQGMTDLDLFIPFVFDDPVGLSGSATIRVSRATQLVLKSAPPAWRIRQLLAISARRDLAGSPLRALIPAWLGTTLRRRLGREL